MGKEEEGEGEIAKVFCDDDGNVVTEEDGGLEENCPFEEGGDNGEIE